MNISGHAKNIWIISKYASSAEYGFESRLFALAREFKKRGRNPVIIASDSNHLASFPEFQSLFTCEIIGGCETWWIKTRKYARTVSISRVVSWLDFELKLLLLPKKRLPAPDVIIVSSLSLLTILNGVWLRHRNRCKLIFEIRDIWPLTLVEEGGYSTANPLVKLLAWVERFGYRLSDLVVGTMPNLSAHVTAVAGEGVRCECVPFGFDPSAFEKDDPLPADYLERHIPKNKFVIGYAGSIGLTNALETVVACAKQLADDDRFFFVFLGGGDRREQFIEETKHLGNVAFLPKVKRTQVQSVLRHCDLLYFAVHDSPVWKFGMSLNKLIDYLMAAKPVLASYSGYQSMLNEAECGDFVPSGDVSALIAAIRRHGEMPPEELSNRGLSGRRWLIENRSWDVLAGQYLAICDALCDPRERASQAGG
jgi:glycosyltransferase involved in cell wall biosynthesis